VELTYSSLITLKSQKTLLPKVLLFKTKFSGAHQMCQYNIAARVFLYTLNELKRVHDPIIL